MKQLALAASAAMLAGSGFAQVVLPPSADPGALQQRRIEEDQRRQEQERLERPAVTDPVKQPPAPSSNAPAGAAQVRFVPKEIRLDPPSEILPATELKALADPYVGKEASLAELQTLVAKINELYKARGIVTARAIIPPQEVTSGVFTIRLVEGRLGKVLISGNETTNESYVLERVDATPDKLMDLSALQESLVQFNRTNDAQLRAELKPGQTFGKTDVAIAVMEPDQHVFRIGLDNGGSEVTGETRLGVSYTNQSLTGRRDSLTLGTMLAEGLKSASVDYGMPVSRSGGRLNVTVNRDDTALKNGPFASLDITGKSTAYALALRQPVAHDLQSQTLVLAGLRRRDVKNHISDVFLSGTKTDDVQLGLEYQRSDERNQWVASYSVFSGKATSSSATGDVKSNFSVGRGSLRHSYALDGGWAVRSSLSFQHTGSGELPTGDYFFLGGEGSVRGYPVGALSGDKGLVASIELQHPITDMPGPGGMPSSFAANGFFFLDVGHVKFVLPPNSELDKSQTITGLGWGTNFAIGKNVSGRVTLAYATTKVTEDQKRFRVGFQLSSQF